MFVILAAQRWLYGTLLPIQADIPSARVQLMGYSTDIIRRRMKAPAIQAVNAIQLPSWTDTVPVHESTYSHPRPYYAASMPVLSSTSRRRVIATAEILISSLSILGLWRYTQHCHADTEYHNPVISHLSPGKNSSNARHGKGERHKSATSLTRLTCCDSNGQAIPIDGAGVDKTRFTNCCSATRQLVSCTNVLKKSRGR
jgi:hypothetical protein